MFILLFCICIERAWCGIILPSHMKLGAGSSAFQIEGSWNVDGKSPSILDTYFRSNQSDLAPPGEACKSYEFYKRDIEMAVEMGLQFYRFSLAWTRILPDGLSNNINEAGVNYYNSLINELLANGVEPVVTLLHFDLPQCLQDLGGWNNPSFKDWFADYARTAFSLFGERVKIWLTINEPVLTCDNIASHFFPKDEFKPLLCAKNIMLAHAKAWRVYDEEFRSDQNGMVSIVNQMMWMIPETEEDEKLAELTTQRFIGMYSNPIFSNEGGWPKDLEEALAENKNATSLPTFTDEEIEYMKGTYDFYGLNYYSSILVRKPHPGEKIGKWPFTGSKELGAVMEPSTEWTHSPTMPSTSVTPEGIRESVKWLNKQYGVDKFFITENGYPDRGDMDDPERSYYIYKHLENLSLAENDGLIQIIGYSVWAFMDDFEFSDGYKSKFGLYSVNFTDPMRTRTPRGSAYYYRNVIANASNGLPIDPPDSY